MSSGTGEIFIFLIFYGVFRLVPCPLMRLSGCASLQSPFCNLPQTALPNIRALIRSCLTVVSPYLLGSQRRSVSVERGRAQKVEIVIIQSQTPQACH